MWSSMLRNQFFGDLHITSQVPYLQLLIEDMRRSTNMACITLRKTQYSFLRIIVLAALTQWSCIPAITCETNSSIPAFNLPAADTYVFKSLYYTIREKNIMYYWNRVISELLLIDTFICKGITKIELQRPWPLFFSPFVFSSMGLGTMIEGLALTC